MVNREPVHGMDYLQHHYEILGVPCDASQDEITQAYRKKMKGLHPDRVKTLDESLQQEADRRTRILQLAYNILKDPEKRAEYDQQLEGFDPKYISEDGTPILNPTAKRIDIDALVRGGTIPKKDEIEEFVESFTGFNQTTLEVLETQYEANPDDPKVRKALREMLERKLHALSYMEKLAWREVGVENQDTPETLYYPEDYQDARDQQFSEYRGGIEQLIAQRVMGIEAGEAPLILPNPEWDGTRALDDPSKYREELTALALEHLEERLEGIKDAASETAEVIDRILSLTDWGYIPEGQELHDNLLMLFLRDDEIAHSLVFEFKEEVRQYRDVTGDYQDIIQGIKLTEFNPDRLSERVQHVLDSEMNIVVMTLLGSIDLHLQVNYVNRQHFRHKHPEIS